MDLAELVDWCLAALDDEGTGLGSGSGIGGGEGGLDRVIPGTANTSIIAHVKMCIDIRMRPSVIVRAVIVLGRPWRRSLKNQGKIQFTGV